MRIVVAGVHGYGRHHLQNIGRLPGAELAGVCDTRPLDGVDVPQSADLPALIEKTGADIAVIATPIHTHAGLAEAALRAGAHVLLEKPPAPSTAEFERILRAVAETGRACQVGFQSLGSLAVPAARSAVGRIRGIGVAGAWERTTGYFTRSAWAGRRRLDGVDVMDGAMTNPFAHAVATALAVAGARSADAIEDIELELYRANAIESDDTSSARLRLADGTVVTVAVSLCAERRYEPYLHVHGEDGQARLFYTTDEIEVDGVRTGYGRVDLLANLLAHVRDGEELLVPLAATGAFTRFVDAVRLAPDPRPIPGEHQVIEPHRRLLPGIAGLAVRSAAELKLLSELGFPGARADAEWPEVTLDGPAAYVYRGDLQATDAPRPYLHPVRTLGGTVVTEAQPADHVHHFGAGVAVADVDGVNFWGGSTYVPGRGPVILPNHGSQRRRRLEPVPGGYAEHLDWVGPDGRVVVREGRRLTARRLDGVWALDFAFTLSGGPLDIQSSACKGRTGAGYGGFFWRAPKDSPGLDAFTAEAHGEQAVHGSRAPWLALVSDAWSLLFLQRGAVDPWFVRVAEYPGAGPALAWDTPLRLDGELSRAVTVVVADGRLSPEAAAELAARAGRAR
ncbi:DUF6807 family protein [Thermoactinospora rubra]|uniref:DUF6807 family protein n=1 Tax=Thermoactinospora rubra TaxID=1088767 RepID=UPI000A0FF04E|nr:DUF6807 family protein [Thermoactinospora rubra]